MSFIVSFLIKTVETNRLSENLRERSVQTLNYIAQSSLPDFETRNLSNLNLLTRNILEGEEDICRVQVKMKDGTILIDEIKPKVGERGEVLSVTRPVIGYSGEIAKISIYWELDRRLSAINKNAWLMVGYSFLAFFLSISLFLFVTSSLILRPVRRIENQLKAVSNGTDYQPLNLSQFYGLELQHFGAAVDELHQRIIEQTDKEEKLLKATIETQDVKQQLVQAIEAVSEGFVYYDADDKLAICNEKYREIYSESADLLVEGNTFEQIIRKGAERGQYGDDNEELEEWILERLEQHRNPSGPIEQKLRNGKWVRIIETRSKDGGLVGIRSDITEFKKHQKELKEAKEAAEQANDTKSQFLAMMSHEIRTPLNAVLGILGFLNDAKLDMEQKKFVQIGLESASNLSTIINDILDFSKLEVGKVELEITAFDPSQAFNSIIDLLEPGAFAKGITLSLEKDLIPKMFLLGDASRLRQILLNLVGNAIKFTQEGDVKVKISTTADADDGINLLFEIQDSGIGVALDKQDLLFGQFVTIEASYTRKFGGTGLGLSICKGFADLMNGDIGVESEEGKGSRFWFEIPLKQAIETALLESDSPEDIGETMIAENSRILLVEDNRANQLVARLILEKIGCKVDIAG
ncbi:MAG: ATP-binding protein, partial [Sneathiella sp.]